MGLVLTTPPAIEPLTPAEVVAHLRLDSSNLEPSPSAPSAALVSGAGNVDNGAHRYRLTFVASDGETDGGDISAAVNVVNKTVAGQVALSNLPLGGTYVTARRVYRTKAGQDLFYLVGTINDNVTTTFTDNVADASLGSGVPITNSTQDPQIARWITAAREYVEALTKRAFITQQWSLSLKRFPKPDCPIHLPRPNLISVESIHYLDFSGTQQTLDPSIYTVLTQTLPGQIYKKFAKYWPVLYPVGETVFINYTCGYGASRDLVPSAIKQAMLLAIGDYYENREANVTGTITAALPTIKRLIDVHRYIEMR